LKCTAERGEEVSATISYQVSEFNGGFEAQIGPELSAVFASEQAQLNTAGVPASVVAVGDTALDAELLQLDGSTTTLSDVLAGRGGVLVF